MNQNVDRLHTMFRKHVISENFMFSSRPSKRGAWFCFVRDLAKFESALKKLIGKTKRMHPTNTFVTELFSDCVLTVFIEEHAIINDPNLIDNIMVTSPELPQCIKVYNPTTCVVIFTEYSLENANDDACKYVDVSTFDLLAPTTPMPSCPSSMRCTERTVHMATMINSMTGDLMICTPTTPWVNSTIARKIHEECTNTCMMCMTTEYRLKTCNGCKLIRYCSIECQKKDWDRGHKECCKSMGAMANSIFKTI